MRIPPPPPLRAPNYIEQTTWGDLSKVESDASCLQLTDSSLDGRSIAHVLRAHYANSDMLYNKSVPSTGNVLTASLHESQRKVK